MTTNRLLIICLAITIMPGCAMLSTSSTELMAKGRKSSSYCFGESASTVAKKIENYFESCDVRPESKVTLYTPRISNQGGFDNFDNFDKPMTIYSPEVRSAVEVYPKSRRVSLVSERTFNMVADVTEIDGNSACRTSVNFYALYIWEPKFRHIEKYIKTNGKSGCNGQEAKLPSSP